MGKGENVGYQKEAVGDVCVWGGRGLGREKKVPSHTSKNYCKNEDQSGITQNSRKVKLLFLTHSHTMTPFDAPGKQTFSHSVFYPFG